MRLKAMHKLEEMRAYWARHKYSIFKFLISVWLVPLIQLSAHVLARQKATPTPVALVVTSRSDRLTTSFVCLVPQLEQASVEVVCFSVNHSRTGLFSKIGHVYNFFDACKRADFVFLDDTFLPVSYALKWKWLFRPRVVQLWHSAGLFKRVGLDLSQGHFIDFLMRLNFRNFDLVAVSAEACRDAIAGFMGLGKDKVIALGTSYTDSYFPPHTDGRSRVINSNKRTLVYAPTFRGDAFKVAPSPAPQIARFLKRFQDDLDCYISTHPQDSYVAKDYKTHFKLDDALAEIDILITDYSSIAMDYILANPSGKLILFVPDYTTYAQTVGFYVPLDEITANVAYDEAALERLIAADTPNDYSAYKQSYLNLSDGHATARLLDHLGITEAG